MRKIRTSLKLAVLAAALAGFATNAQAAWAYTASGPWVQVHYANGWSVYQNGWGSPNYQGQTLYANSPGNWASAGSFTGGGVKCYPHVQKDVNLPLDGNHYCTATFNVSVPNNPWYNFMFDNWTANMQDELIVSEQWNGDAIWGDLIAQNVSIGGRTWSHIRKAHNGANNVIVFTPSSKRTSGTEDCMALFMWAKNNGHLVNSSSFFQLSFGVEITYTSGWQQFTCNSYSASFGQNGGGGGGGTYYKLRNRTTNLCIDSMGRTANGSNCGQYSSGGSYNQQWAIVPAGSYVKLQNRASGIYVDGMGRTANGSVAGLWGSSSSYNQQWMQTTTSGYYKYQNRATGLYLDGMGYNWNGADLCQWAGGGSYNQQWSRVAP